VESCLPPGVPQRGRSSQTEAPSTAEQQQVPGEKMQLKFRRNLPYNFEYYTDFQTMLYNFTLQILILKTENPKICYELVKNIKQPSFTVKSFSHSKDNDEAQMSPTN